MNKLFNSTNIQNSIIILLTQLYIVLCCFPHLTKLPITGYKLQPSELIFFLLSIFIFTQKSFYIYLTNTFTAMFKKKAYLILSISFYLSVVFISTGFNFFKTTLLETIGVLYLVTAFFVLFYIFSHDRFGNPGIWKKRLIFSMIIAGASGLVGWFFHMLGFENPTGIVRNYPYFGEVFRLQGFTATPAFFFNIVGTAFIMIWMSDDRKAEFNSGKILLFILGAALVLTLSKSLLIILICILLFEVLKKDIPKNLKTIGFITAFGIFIFLQTATHFLFVSSETATTEETFIDDTYVSNLPIYQSGDFCILETNYLLYKRSAIIAGYRNPLFGVGLGQHTYFLQNLATEPAYIDKYHGQSGDSHSTFTGMFGELGILGFLSVIFLFMTLFKVTMHLPSQFWWTVLFFTLESINADIMNFRHFWIFIALIAAFAAKGVGKKQGQ